MLACFRPGHPAGVAQPGNLLLHMRRGRPAQSNRAAAGRGTAKSCCRQSLACTCSGFKAGLVAVDKPVTLLQAWRACAGCGSATIRWRCRSCTGWTCWRASRRASACCWTASATGALSTRPPRSEPRYASHPKTWHTSKNTKPWLHCIFSWHAKQNTASLGLQCMHGRTP